MNKLTRIHNDSLDPDQTLNDDEEKELILYVKLEVAWGFIKNQIHWKNPVDAIIPQSMFVLCSQACRHYTATELFICDTDEKRKLFRVKSKGYRAGPAGDH